MNTIAVETNLNTIECGECGGVYAILSSFRIKCAQEGKSWSCPYCRVGWGYSGNSENSKLKKEIERLNKNCAWHKQKKEDAQKESEYFRRSRDGMKGALTKVKKRASAGLCPCCNRTFKQLAAHMKNKHPEYSDES